MAFSVPTSWRDLTPQQLRMVFRLMWLYWQYPDWEDRVKMAALLQFCHIEVVDHTDGGWLCREQTKGREFLLDSELLPSMLSKVDWVVQTDSIDVRIGRVGDCVAVDFELRELMFGDYIMCDNYYQAFLQTKDDRHLLSMARLLYRVPEGRELFIEPDVLMGVFLWFNGAKRVLSQAFPHFLKPAGSGGGNVTMEGLRDSARAQIRSLTKGDVTKQDYILNKTDTWTALGELDALAMEAEEIKRKYGK